MLVEAERYLSHGLLDHAERLFRQVADADPRSSIAAVGLARVALERGDEARAYAFARRGLAIDPENPAAHHLVLRLEEVVRGRGEALPTDEEIARITRRNETSNAARPLAGGLPPASPPRSSASPPPPSAPVDAAGNPDPRSDGPPPRARRAGAPARRPGLLGRLFDRRRPG
ncbi:MAG TPA: tetratricopeptide repeat protein [Candidatus Dormibacteraeota bacterium]|nr:tetratricopeptide repeat protein [Candidatus Dormibacteraeota bacterium]